MKKSFVLDTNVLLHNANSFEVFADNTVIIPMAVIEELDKFKSQNDELGRNARYVIRKLDKLRKKGKLGEGVRLENGGTLIVALDSPDDPDVEALKPPTADNRIIRIAYELNKRGEKVIFVSKDINARIKADALGVYAVDFEKQKVNFDELYTGYRTLAVSKENFELFRVEGKLNVNGKNKFNPNEFVVLKVQNDDSSGSLIGRFAGEGIITALSHEAAGAWNIKPRSAQQEMALELLMDEKVPLVTLVGQAGTGKTLLALAAGLEQIIKRKKYDKMLVSRPIMPLGKDIGFLPGDKDTKLQNWMQPIFDNLAYLMRNESDPKHPVREKIEKLQRDNIVELEALTYIRGRSIPRQYVIIDEAQNLTPHEIKTIISRAGEGTKMVLTGDPSQIDNPYLDSNSNGLSYTVEKLKDNALHGHVTLIKSERSSLAAVAADIL
jgi:PhoH-like ATPase